MIKQTFIEKVPETIEILSQAAQYAGDKQSDNLDVRLEVRYMGLEIRMSRTKEPYLTINRIIGWAEFAKAKETGLELVKFCIDRCEAEINSKLPPLTTVPYDEHFNSKRDKLAEELIAEDNTLSFEVAQQKARITLLTRMRVASLSKGVENV